MVYFRQEMFFYRTRIKELTLTHTGVCRFLFAHNVLRLGVCYFALQIFRALDKFNRQNNRHQAAVSGWCGLKAK